MNNRLKSSLSVSRVSWLVLLSVIAGYFTTNLTYAQCTMTKTAEVVALDQPFFYNRLGAVNPAGMIFALRRDVVSLDGGTTLIPGNVGLRDGKRPRPIVLRLNAGECLAISFQNLLNPTVPPGVALIPGLPEFPRDEQPATRSASVHVMGMQLANGIASDGSNVGTNGSSLAPPDGTTTRTYTFYAEHEGTFLLYSTGATTGGEGDGGSLSAGLFGAVNVEPPGAEYYRSQVTADDLAFATKKDINGNPTQTPAGQPVLDYDAVYPAGHPQAGIPILKMTQGNAIVHTDINAIVTGPGRGGFGTFYRNTPINPNRNEPFREFTVIFHDEITAVQAFPEFQDPVLKFTLHSVRDGFAINYGTGGVGAEILANRKAVGPMSDCTECKYEEFFLTSWVVGDPAMVVDFPANNGLGVRATTALYPDDPSNVHHSYINEHVKFRNLHAGPKEHHIFHLHAHQWAHTPDSDNSAYLDSQAIGPGQGWTYEITYNGSGNRNKTVGDAIFHCHFYPHFAQGMWELWRVHDVFEDGTRKLPDAEIADGTPIPALVPIPTLAMAPMPGATVSIVNGQAVVTGSGNPGYPFFIAGVAGHRPPTPPLDILQDGGLPRHVITGGTAEQVQTRLDFSKRLLTANAIQVPEDGTPLEQAAMAFHHTRVHPSFTPEGSSANFITNGSPRGGQPGAPFADPCIDDAGNPVGVNRLYKAAAIQLDIKLNKAGWHFPQSRILTLWGDVAPTLNGTRPPEPFFFRANTNDCITFYHSNLVPNEYMQDDFQVRTPTDILGQHIHLVKFDVTSSDGSGNGWNYEDGTFSFQEVKERIDAINAGTWNGSASPNLACAPGGPLGTPCARTTIQRWYADNTLNLAGKDRTLRTVFTHDHFGPSTHQQAGLYASLVIEPQGSSWRNPETGVFYGTRDDGGPTSWRADILTANTADSYREFMFQFADFQLAYRADNTPVNPPARNEDPIFGQVIAPNCPGGVPRPCPEAISADDVGTGSANYRNEPLALRVRDPNTNAQAAGDAGDLSKAFLSNITRADPALNSQPAFYPPLTGGVQPGDPFTPLLRAYENDKVQIRVQVGATEEGHNTSIHGVKWLFEPSDPNSGYRNSEMIGISEHFEFLLPGVAAVKGGTNFADYRYQVGSSSGDLWDGEWGILRAYNGGNGLQPDLLALPSNPKGKAPTNNVNAGSFSGVCPKTAPARNFSIAAVTAQQALPGGSLVYNPRIVNGGPLNDPTAILYVRSGDLASTGKLKPGVPIEPLILRANAGDCINVTLTNKLPATLPEVPDGVLGLPMIVDNFNANQLAPSNQVGLHPQLLTFDVSSSDGANTGFNTVQTVGPGGIAKYKWYAGDIRVNADGSRTATPVEYGAVNLISSDPIKHPGKGAIGALIIEPQGSTILEDADDPTKDRKTRDTATIIAGGSSFRDFVLLYQNSVNLRYANGTAVPLVAQAEDPEDSGHNAFNYRTEPMWFRMGFAPDTPLTGPTGTRTFDFTDVLSNSQVGGDPVTPIFTASSGTPIRFRILHPGGSQRNNVFQVHGHIWEEEPFINSSTALGNNPFSEWFGSQMGIGPTSHFNFLLMNGAGGKYGTRGDYLYRDQPSLEFDKGLWGIFRVQ